MKIVKIGIIFYCKKIVKSPKFNIRLTLTSIQPILLLSFNRLKLPLNLAFKFGFRGHPVSFRRILCNAILFTQGTGPSESDF